jgi:hypothetical protein
LLHVGFGEAGKMERQTFVVDALAAETGDLRRMHSYFGLIFAVYEACIHVLIAPALRTP